MRYAIGFDLGGTNLESAAVTESGSILSRAQEPGGEDAAVWRERILARIDQIAAAHGPAVGIGLAAPGLVAKNGRSIAWMAGRMDALQDLDWERHLGIGRAIPVLNDAQAALLGESWIGAAAGGSNVMLLTLGTGVGGAAMVDGHLLRGHIGRAGHLGHLSIDPFGEMDIVGTPGSLEGAIGDCTVTTRSGGRFASTTALVAAAESGNAEALAVWHRSLDCLAAGIVSLINVLDPETIVIGGGIAAAGEALFIPLRERLDMIEWRPGGARVQLVPAVLGELAGAVGAARHAHDQS